MATVNGNTISSQDFGGWYAQMTYDSVTETATSYSLRVTTVCAIANKKNPPNGWTGDWFGFPWDVETTSNAVAVSLTSATTQTSKPKSTNRGSGAYTKYTWTFNKTYTWSKGHAAQTKSVVGKVTINACEWGDVSSIGPYVEYLGNVASTATLNVTVPALESWTVDLDARGGTGTAATLTKYYGESLTLPQPVKEGDTFSGWALASDPYTVVYEPGDTYDANAAASLVAVYASTITSAVITQLYAARDDGSFTWDSQTGTHTSASDDGEYVYIRAWWRVDGADAATISLGASMADTSTVWTGTTRQVSKPGTGELYIEGVAEWGTTQTALVTGQYDVTVGLSTGAGNPSDSRGTTVSTAFFTIDVLAGGHGIAFGKPATQQLFDVGMETNFDHDVRVMGTPLVPIGTILDFAAATAPTGYLVCDGSAVSRTNYAALFAVIGTTWGAGDGSTTFNLPDFRGRTSIGAGTGTASDATAHALASSGGAETHHHNGGSHTLTTAQIPAHNHLPSTDTDYKFAGIKPLSGTAGQFDLQGHSSGAHRYALASSESGRTTYWSNTQNAGGGGAHSHGATTDTSSMQPFATVTKIIRAI